MKTTMRISAALLLAAAAGCSGADPLGGLVLQGGSRVGSAYTHDRTETVEGWLSVTADGKESRQPLARMEHRVFEDEILDMDGPKIMKLRRKNTAWELRRQGPGDAALRPVARSLTGKTIVVRRGDLGTEIEGADGVTADERRANSIDALEAILSLPAGPVAPGQEWEIDGERLVEIFGGEGESGLKVRDARGTGRLERLEGSGAARVAVVLVRIRTVGSLRRLLDVDMTLTLEGTFRLEVGTGRLLGFDAQGRGEISGEVDRGGKPAVYAGTIKLAVEGRNIHR